ncbi:ATP-binding protein [Streptomyces pini]|uniref:Anti-sigma regulatory factor (Ser/Thr protein kinase) n=1 Tax=Streptomyces pini TaxID=1520580 RepID=A0A1I3YFE8_9ACTN|nr:ATP-binding protein [Streptomyces pini]SFK30079.1 Anti-sigma regulatory factor (Ser/Thr protein kinase) [Streptomyces pini]
MALSPGTMTLPGPVGVCPDLRQETFELPAQPFSVADARDRAFERLLQWGLSPEVCRTARLVVSELFTNAVLHTDSDRIGCLLYVADNQIRIEVRDQGSYASTPVLCFPRADEERGRGLQLIESLTQAWGVESAGLGLGHIVWAVIRP